MSKFHTWIHALRLRTLPLAVSGIVLGSFLAASHQNFHWNITIWAIITAVLLQILSNLANDYGDFSKGTDNENRVGPTRALQSGIIQPQEMKMALVITAALTLISGITLLTVSFDAHQLVYALLFFGLGVASIWAAITYTMGKKAYGYHGLGDVFVFVFFGWISVFGVYFLHTQSLTFSILLPASAIGFLSAGVLNLNNTRDIENDLDSGKLTFAVKLGLKNARTYQVVLFGLAVIFSSLYTTLFGSGMWQQLYWISVIPLAFVASKVLTVSNPRDLDPLLKVQALSTLLYSIAFGLGQVV